MKIVVSLLLLVASAFAQHSPEYTSAEKKLQAMDEYSAGTSHAGKTTVLTDAELNAFFAEGGVKLPDGVSDLRIDDQAGVVNGSAQVDFDKVTAKNRSNNMLMMIFTGVHTVRVRAEASGAKGRAHVKIGLVSLDGLEIPPAALELFVQKYLQPKYPEADLDAVFGMPNRVDAVTLGDHQITFVQR
jgi:hypothetical protein